MKTEAVYVTDSGPKRLSEMTREELIAALEETGRALIAARKQAQRDLDFFAPRRIPEYVEGPL